ENGTFELVRQALDVRMIATPVVWKFVEGMPDRIGVEAGAFGIRKSSLAALGVSVGLHGLLALGLGWGLISNLRPAVVDMRDRWQDGGEREAGLIRPKLLPELPMTVDGWNVYRLNLSGTVVTMSAGLLGNRIVTMKQNAGGWDIVTMNVDGSGERSLTDDPAMDEDPVWSPDGGTVYFASSRGRTQPTTPTADDPIRVDVWAMEADGSNLRRLTDGTGINRQPQPSPDGSRLVFMSNRTGYWKLYLMNADGSNLRQLTHGTSVDRFARWSPDGTRIAYDSTEDPGTLTDWDDIWMIDADGSNPRNLTEGSDWNDHGPVWTPDGERIVFYSYRDRNDEIYIMDADGTHQERLTFDDASDQHPRVSPDGSKILFVSNRDGARALYMMNLDGTEVARVSTETTVHGQGSWSPGTD
ncbi:MAG: DPP IV N-terminal domain-containing protein, partial [Candidatus Poribacteria bacterium]|nr:DPP IV N-terminal domain-containing protein [Candidatus Poribacteria bacterium]